MKKEIDDYYGHFYMIYNDLSNDKKKKKKKEKEMQKLGSFYCLNWKKIFGTNFLKFKKRDEKWDLLFSHLKREFIVKFRLILYFVTLTCWVSTSYIQLYMSSYWNIGEWLH